MDKTIIKKLDTESVAPVRFARSGKDYLITNDVGSFHFLTEKEFESFLSGKLPQKGRLWKELAEEGFIMNAFPFDVMVDRWRKRNEFLFSGPTLHIVVVTLRCDHRCVYCQTSSHKDDRRYDMSEATARRVVNRIFEAPAPSVTIEFQGGEPLLNWPTVSFIVKYAREKSRKTGKKVLLNLVSNMNNMTEERLDFLLKHDVNFCTSIDGPAAVHNRNRVFTGGDSHANAVKWFRRIGEKTQGKVFRADALLTVTRTSLAHYKEIVDEYVSLGARGMFIRPLTPLGMALETWRKIGYSPEEFLEFYEKALDYIIDINAGGRDFSARNALNFLMKILSDTDSNFLDLRSPCGGAIGQLAYNYDGKVFVCDEARMLHEMGDSSFCLGDVAKGKYKDFVSHDSAKCVVTASCTELPTSCSECVYKPYCGVCPVLNYIGEGDIYGRMPQNARCRINKGILNILFKRIRDKRSRNVFQKWVDTGADRISLEGLKVDIQ